MIEAQLKRFRFDEALYSLPDPRITVRFEINPVYAVARTDAFREPLDNLDSPTMQIPPVRDGIGEVGVVASEGIFKAAILDKVASGQAKLVIISATGD